MAHREFLDENGGLWQVWDVFPSGFGGLNAERRSASANASDPQRRRAATFTLPVQFRGGWLAFQSQVESRRLAPIPTDWASLPDSELAVLVRSAPPTRRHGRSAGGQPAGEQHSHGDHPHGDHPVREQPRTER